MRTVLFAFVRVRVFECFYLQVLYVCFVWVCVSESVSVSVFLSSHARVCLCVQHCDGNSGKTSSPGRVGVCITSFRQLAKASINQLMTIKEIR